MNGNNIEKVKEIIKETTSFINNITLEEGKAPDKGAIVFKFDGGKMLSPIIIGSADLLKSKQALDFIIKNIEMERDLGAMPEDVRNSLMQK